MSHFNCFANYDELDVYKKVLEDAVDIGARNFVIDFGSRMSRITSNVGSNDFNSLLTEAHSPRSKAAPTRWM